MTDPLQRIRTFVLAHKGASVAVAAALVILLAVFELRSDDKTQYLTSRVTRGDIHDVVEATGTINAVTTVQVGSQVSGTIAKLYADFNSRVYRGQVIALIDPALFQGALGEATADLENSKANLTASGASLAKARATEAQTKADFQRADVLV
jgi:HlyD family secretion protein